jgi:hypothetical protein
MDADQLRERLRERAVCEKEHVERRVPHNGFGWVGTCCPDCGFMFFGEWEDWAAPMMRRVEQR